MNVVKRSAFVALLLFNFVGRSASAQVVIASNLSNTVTGLASSSYMAQAFTTDDGTYLLDDIQANLGGGSTPVTVDVQIYANASGKPSMSLLDLGAQSARAVNLTTWTAPSPFVLMPNTTYWAVAIGPSSMGWRLTTNLSYTGVGTLGGSATGVNGTTWNLSSTSHGMIRIDGTSIPAVGEPAPLVLATLPFALMLTGSLSSQLRTREA